MFRQDFYVSRPTRVLSLFDAYGAVTPLWPTFPSRSALCHDGAGLIPVCSPLLRESLLMSFPPGTEMFQFPGFAL